MRVLVTGGAGFIGSHIVDRLVREGLDVAVVDNLSSGSVLHLPPTVRFYRLDIADPALGTVLAEERPEAVIHCAAQVEVRRSVEDPVADARVNVLGTLALLEHCRRHGVRKVVFASSAAVYGNPLYLPVDEAHPTLPLSPYGVAKLAVEHYLRTYAQLYGLAYTILRYANVYGPRQEPAGEGGVVAIFADRLLRGLPPAIHGDGRQTRDFIYVGDVAEANLLALTRGDGHVLNVSWGQEITVLELCRQITQLAGLPLQPVFQAERPGDIRRSVLANTRAREVLGWAPRVPLADGLAAVVAARQAVLARRPA